MADEAELRKVIRAVTEFVRGCDESQAPGAEIGKFVRREFPDFDRQGAGFESVTDMLDRAAPELSIVGRQGQDYVWSTIVDLDVLDPQLDGDDATTGSGTAYPCLDGFHACAFKSLDQFQVPLRRFNVIVGANGAGKTSILEGLFILSQLRFKKPGTVFSGSRRLERVQTADASLVPVSLSASSGSQEITYWGLPRPDDVDQHHVSMRDGQTTTQYVFTRTLPPGLPRDLPWMRVFAGAALLRLEARCLARPAASHRERPTLRHDGTGLPAVLADLAATDRDRLDRVVQATADIIPAVQGVRMPRHRFDGSEEIGNGLELQLYGKWLDASLVSEGTMLVLGLMTIVHGLANTRLLLMDDIERALHPKAQRTLVRQLVAMTEGDRGLQLVCTTHSPYLLDAVDPEDVLVVRASPDTGLSRCRRLVEHEAWDKWRTSMTPGEFWSYVGEDWLESE